MDVPLEFPQARDFLEPESVDVPGGSRRGGWEETAVGVEVCADDLRGGKVLISPKIGTYFPHCISSISGVLARISTNTRPCIKTCIRGCISVF